MAEMTIGVIYYERKTLLAGRKSMAGKRSERARVLRSKKYRDTRKNHDKLVLNADAAREQ